MNIELKHIHKRFGAVLANDDISLTFSAGRIVGVLGENGAGKSTLMKILSGYQRPDSGLILLDGQPAAYHSPLDAIAHGVGMLQQDPLDIAPFTVLENFTYGRPGGLSMGRQAARKALFEIARRYGFTLDPETPISHLSIGQRQQLEIARLLSLGVKTLILDEPTTGISAEQKTILFQSLRALARDDGMSILLVSHKLEDVIALCDEVVVLRGGRFVGGATMPATPEQLVGLMFGQPLPPEPRPAAQLGKPVVQLDHVTIRTPRLTIQDFSLTLRAGEVVGLAGLDHSGQELVLRACVGLARPSHGTLTIGGRDLTHKPYRDFVAAGAAFGAAGRIEEGLIAGLTTTEHIALTATTGALVNWANARTITEAQLKQYDVRGTPASPVETLSGGNQQRLLMALMPQSPVLMALEQPTRGLDVESARWIWAQLLERRAHGTAILFLSPDLDELIAYSDRIFVFFAGRFCEVPDVRAATIDQLGRLIGGDFTPEGR
ncbi:MAG: ATP-binding cassette domain-containing protein [bacterium]|nr:ATP-binding cassette domain-containing protein [bacterium]